MFARCPDGLRLSRSWGQATAAGWNERWTGAGECAQGVLSAQPAVDDPDIAAVIAHQTDGCGSAHGSDDCFRQARGREAGHAGERTILWREPPDAGQLVGGQPAAEVDRAIAVPGETGQQFFE